MLGAGCVLQRKAPETTLDSPQETPTTPFIKLYYMTLYGNPEVVQA